VARAGTISDHNAHQLILVKTICRLKWHNDDDLDSVDECNESTALVGGGNCSSCTKGDEYKGDEGWRLLSSSRVQGPGSRVQGPGSRVQGARVPGFRSPLG